MKTITYISLFTLLLFACNQTKQPIYSLRDSVLNEYLYYHDSVNYWDTKDLDYNLLRAYQTNDTIFLKNLQSLMRLDEQSQTLWGFIAKRFKLASIENLRADEAYRFNYSANYCPYGTVITISRIGDSINLHAIVLEGLSQDADTSKVKEEYDKKLTQKNLDDVDKALENVDFWNMKYFGERIQYDESDFLKIDGYIKGNALLKKPPRDVSICRILINEQPFLNKLLTLVLKLAGIKEKC